MFYCYHTYIFDGTTLLPLITFTRGVLNKVFLQLSGYYWLFSITPLYSRDNVSWLVKSQDGQNLRICGPYITVAKHLSL